MITSFHRRACGSASRLPSVARCQRLLATYIGSRHLDAINNMHFIQKSRINSPKILLFHSMIISPKIWSFHPMIISPKKFWVKWLHFWVKWLLGEMTLGEMIRPHKIRPYSHKIRPYGHKIRPYGHKNSPIWYSPIWSLPCKNGEKKSWPKWRIIFSPFWS